MHISSVSRDLVVLLFVVGTGESFDLAKVIFQVIMSNAESEKHCCSVALSFLDISIVANSKEHYGRRRGSGTTSKSYQDLYKAISDYAANVTPVADNVAIDAAFNVTPFKFLSFQFVQIYKRRLEVAKRLKKIKIEHILLRNENVQLAAYKACVKRLMEQHPDEDDPAPT